MLDFVRLKPKIAEVNVRIKNYVHVLYPLDPGASALTEALVRMELGFPFRALLWFRDVRVVLNRYDIPRVEWNALPTENLHYELVPKHQNSAIFPTIFQLDGDVPQ